MIVLVEKPDNAKVYIETVSLDESDPEKSTYVLRVDVEQEPGSFWEQVFGGEKTMFSFGMEGWAGDYGKPLDFFLSMHLGSEAPEFTLEFATKPEIDTKVYIKFFPTKATAKVVDGNRNDALESIKKQIKEYTENRYITNMSIYLSTGGTAGYEEIESKLEKNAKKRI